MRYLLEYISMCKNDFIVWWKVKLIFVCVEVILEISYFVIGLAWNQVLFINYLSLFLLIQAILFLVFLRLQFGFEGHLTIYDKMRINKTNYE